MQTVPPVTAPVVVSTIHQPHYLSKYVLDLSIIQSIIGVLCISFQFVLIAFSSWPFIGQGLWAGAFFIVAGSFGIASSRRKSACLIVAFLTLAVISAVVTIGILVSSSLAIENDYGYWIPDSGYKKVIAFQALLIVLALIQAVVAIISSALSCLILYGGDESLMLTRQVQNSQGPDGQQQMAMVPFSQHAADGPQQMAMVPFSQHAAALPAEPSVNPGQIQPPANSQTPPQTSERDTTLLIQE